VPAPGGQEYRRAVAAVGRTDHRGEQLLLLDEGGCFGEVAGQDALDGAHLDRRQQVDEGTRAVSLIDEPGGEHIPRVVIPDDDRDAARQPGHFDRVLDVLAAGGECPERLPQRNQTLGIPGGELESETVQQHVACIRRSRRRRCRRRGPSQVEPLGEGNVTSQEGTGREGVQIRRAGSIGIDGLEPVGRLRHQHDRLAAAARGEQNPGPDQVQVRPVSLVERRRIEAIKQGSSLRQRTRVVFRFSAGDGQRGPAAGIRGEIRG
jgi:hypothetical protein